LLDRLTELEHRWSRFLADSEINAINAAAGTAVTVSPDTQLLVERAISASRRTRGWFDPTLLNELVEAGYNQTFEQLPARGLGQMVITVHRSADGDQVRLHDWNAVSSSIVTDPLRGSVMVPRGVGIDPGGIGKGLAADILLQLALESGASAAMVDLGGDLVMGGRAPDAGWPIAIEDPFDRSAAALEIRLDWGAVATSSRSRRRWLDEGAERNHLIDPSTGTSTDSNVAACTVIGAECWLAESYAKAAVLAGKQAGLEMLEEDGLEGLLFGVDGSVHRTPGMGQFTA
ncbi:MAG: FAD:protein FMN transferase, partial [Acidimicrobiales bacterium]